MCEFLNRQHLYLLDMSWNGFSRYDAIVVVHAEDSDGYAGSDILSGDAHRSVQLLL